jgi:hypothetical protein
MAVVVIDAGSRQTAGAVIMEAWKFGIDVERLHDNQIELTSAYDNKLDLVVNKFKGVKVLHKELLKIVNDTN